MTDFLKPLTRFANRIKRHNFKSAQSPCALVSCTGSRPLWQRLRRQGAFLQGAFYCQPQCLEAALVSKISQLRVLAVAPQQANRSPLGLLMVAAGRNTVLEVRAALEAQRRARYGKIGEWIEKLGFATEQEVTTALALQWGCPVAASFDPSTIHSLGNIPLPILEAFQMLPLNHVAATNTLYLAFGERVDHGALYAIEKILACRTQPCVAGRKSVACQLDSICQLPHTSAVGFGPMRQFPHTNDVKFGPRNDLAEMARIASIYTARLSPEAVRLSRIGRFIWLRLDVRSKTPSTATNLVFRLPTDSPRPLPFARPFRDLPAPRPQPA